MTPGTTATFSAYEDLLRDVWENGTRKQDRTGTGTRAVFGRQIRFDLAQGFPLVTTKKVQLHVSNARTTPARLIIEERVPVSEVKEVEIQVLTKDSPANKDGIVRIEVELGANATKTTSFSWELSAAAKVSGV